MAHLAPRPWLSLAVQVQAHPRHFKRTRPVRVATGVFPHLTQEVDHDSWGVKSGFGDRHTGQHPHQLLELRRVASVHRVVARVVRSWSKFVYKYFILFRDEHLDRDQPDNVQVSGDVRGELPGAIGDIVRYSCRDYRCVEDVIAVNILGNRERGHLTRRRSGTDCRYLHSERHKLLHNEFGIVAAQQFVRVFSIFRPGDDDLTLAVVTHRGGF